MSGFGWGGAKSDGKLSGGNGSWLQVPNTPWGKGGDSAGKGQVKKGGKNK